MNQTLIDAVSPYLTVAVQALIGVLVGYALAGAKTVRQKVNAWLESRTTAAQREILHKLAVEAFALAETAYKDHSGPQKFQVAEQYVLKELADVGIKLPAGSIQGAIENAVLEYNKSKEGATTNGAGN